MKSIFYSSEAIFGGLLVGAGHRKDQAMIRSSELIGSPHPTSPAWGKGLETELVMPALKKHPNSMGSESFWVGKQIYTKRMIYPDSRGTAAPELGTFPGLALCFSSSGCSSVPSIVSFNKLVNKSKFSLEFCELL